MSWATGLMVYLVIWWTVLFAVLPLGVKRVEKPGGGRSTGAGTAAAGSQSGHHLDRGGSAVDRLLCPAPDGLLQLSANDDGS